MVRGIIYKYTSPSGKSYIGQTIDEKRRRQNWFSSSYEYAGTAINRARAKYGRDAFTYAVIFTHSFQTKTEAKELLNVMEKYYIKKYNTFANGYNCDEGGRGAADYKLSKEARKNISLGVKSWTSTSEGKKKLSLAHKEVPHKKGYRLQGNFIPIVQLSKEGKWVNEFDSITDAAIHINNNKSKCSVNISSVCKGKRDTAEGYKWMYKDDYYKYFLHPELGNIPKRVQRALDYVAKLFTPKKKKVYKRKYKKKEDSRINRHTQQIGQYNENLELVKVWRNGLEASNILGFSSANIYRSTRTLGKYMGYYWRKYEGQQTILPKEKRKIKKPQLNKKVVQMNLQGEELFVFDSIGDACKAVNASNRTLLSRCLNGKGHTAYGYKWKFLNCA